MVEPPLEQDRSFCNPKRMESCDSILFIYIYSQYFSISLLNSLFMLFILKRFIRHPFTTLLMIVLIFIVFFAQQSSILLYFFQTDQLNALNIKMPAISVIYGNAFYTNGHSASLTDYQSLVSSIETTLNDIESIHGLTSISYEKVYNSHYIIPCQIDADGLLNCVRNFSERYTQEEIENLIHDTTTFVGLNDPCHVSNTCPIGGDQLTLPLYGITNESFQMLAYTDMRISQGRSLTQQEIDNGTLVCLIPEGINQYHTDTLAIEPIEIGKTIPLSVIQNGTTLTTLELTVIGKYTPAQDYLGYVDQTNGTMYASSALPQNAIIVSDQVAMQLMQPLMEDPSLLNIYHFGQPADQFVHGNLFTLTHPILEWDSIQSMNEGIPIIQQHLDQINLLDPTDYVYFVDSTNDYIEPLISQYENGQTIFLILTIIFEILGTLILILLIYSDAINDRHTVTIYRSLGQTKRKLIRQKTILWMSIIIIVLIPAIIVSPLICQWIIDQFYRIDPLVLPTILRTGIGHFIDLNDLITITQADFTPNLTTIALFFGATFILCTGFIFAIQRHMIGSSEMNERSKSWN